MKLTKRFKFYLRDRFFPGVDLHTRNRAKLCAFWKSGHRAVLDAGSGNGYFSWLAYRSGAAVVAINMDQQQVRYAEEYFLDYKQADRARLTFEHRNLYDLREERRQFDEIICYETLEHVRRDSEVVTEFYRILKPGGTLHLCCPYSIHPRHQREKLDLEEYGGHVREGYTEQEYRSLLEPIGFNIDLVKGLGSYGVYLADEIMRGLRVSIGDLAALPLLPFGLIIMHWAPFSETTPYSLYVRAVKPAFPRSTTKAGA